MTGFARLAAEFAWGTATWEIRSVNHRYLELVFRLPESLRVLEPQLRQLVQLQVKRGKIEVSLKVQFNPAANPLQFNYELIDQLLKIYQAYSQIVPNAQLDFANLLSWPGVMQNTVKEFDDLQEVLSEPFSQLLVQFQQMRQREGQSIKQFLSERLELLAQQISSAERYLPEILSQMRLKLQNRLAELEQNLDPLRLEQEMVILAQRLDVAEELDRLQQHVKQVSELLQRVEPVGRRLDFLMQELNREANTLSSKINDIRVTQIAVEMKVLIEQMREQVQNIE